MKNYTNELIYKTEIDPQAQRVELPTPEGKEAGEGIKVPFILLLLLLSCISRVQLCVTP